MRIGCCAEEGAEHLAQGIADIAEAGGTDFAAKTAAVVVDIDPDCHSVAAVEIEDSS